MAYCTFFKNILSADGGIMHAFIIARPFIKNVQYAI